jgi:hypothetical protein
MVMAVFWDIVLPSLVDWLDVSEELTVSSSGCPDDRGSTLLWNFIQYLPDYMVQHPRRQPSSRVVRHSAHFSNSFMILHASLAVMFIYCRYKSIVVKLITQQIFLGSLFYKTTLVKNVYCSFQRFLNSFFVCCFLWRRFSRFNYFHSLYYSFKTCSDTDIASETFF